MLIAIAFCEASMLFRKGVSHEREIKNKSIKRIGHHVNCINIDVIVLD